MSRALFCLNCALISLLCIVFIYFVGGQVSNIRFPSFVFKFIEDSNQIYILQVVEWLNASFTISRSRSRARESAASSPWHTYANSLAAPFLEAEGSTETLAEVTEFRAAWRKAMLDAGLGGEQSAATHALLPCSSGSLDFLAAFGATRSKPNHSCLPQVTYWTFFSFQLPSFSSLYFSLPH